MEIKKLADLLPYCRENISKKTLAVIRAEDDHTLKAVAKAKNEGVIQPMLIGNASVIENILKEIKEDKDAYTIVNAEDDEKAVGAAIEMVHAHEVDVIMKGTLETKDLMKRIVAKESNMRTDRLMSKFDIVENPGYHKIFGFADSALNPKPDVLKKKQIIQNSLDVLYTLGIKTPKVAVLAASETVNPKLQESTDAAELKEMYIRGEFTNCLLEGPISIDLALDPESVRVKNYKSEVGGDADLLICPDLVSGNLMGKGMLITGAKAAGIIVGAKVPIVLMSRSAAINDKFYSILLGAIAASKSN